MNRAAKIPRAGRRGGFYRIRELLDKHTARRQMPAGGSCAHMSDSSGDFAGTQTPGTNIDMARGTVHDCLYTLDIGLPHAVRAPMGVGHLDPEGNTLVTELTFSHPLHLLAVLKYKRVRNAPLDIITEFDTNCKRNFTILQNFLRSCQAHLFIL